MHGSYCRVKVRRARLQLKYHTKWNTLYCEYSHHCDLRTVTFCLHQNSRVKKHKLSMRPLENWLAGRLTRQLMKILNAVKGCFFSSSLLFANTGGKQNYFSIIIHKHTNSLIQFVSHKCPLNKYHNVQRVRFTFYCTVAYLIHISPHGDGFSCCLTVTMSIIRLRDFCFIWVFSNYVSDWRIIFLLPYICFCTFTFVFLHTSVGKWGENIFQRWCFTHATS